MNRLIALHTLCIDSSHSSLHPVKVRLVQVGEENLGRVIGRGGSTIRTLSEESGAKVESGLENAPIYTHMHPYALTCTHTHSPLYASPH
jgi:polyribonucleotide nucleotidyltransferase